MVESGSAGKHSWVILEVRLVKRGLKCIASWQACQSKTWRGFEARQNELR